MLDDTLLILIVGLRNESSPKEDVLSFLKKICEYLMKNTLQTLK
jgi:hypothetical protein